jgi:hypothetical protein
LRRCSAAAAIMRARFCAGAALQPARPSFERGSYCIHALIDGSRAGQFRSCSVFRASELVKGKLDFNLHAARNRRLFVQQIDALAVRVDDEFVIAEWDRATRLMWGRVADHQSHDRRRSLDHRSYIDLTTPWGGASWR